MSKKKEIFSAACSLMRAHGAWKVTREQIAEAADVAPALVSYYHGSMEEIRDSVAQEALKTKDWLLLSRFMVLGHPISREMTLYVRNQCLRAMADEIRRA